MLMTIALVLAVLAGGFFAFRYFSLRRALGETRAELALVRQDLSQNQMLHLPLPDAELAALLDNLNALLAEIQAERQAYAKRERGFQEQIEAISHDLRTPLTVILGNLKLFKQSQQAQIANDPALAETIAVLEQKAEAMKSLVGQFYDYSRLSAGDMALQLTRLDAGRTLRETLAGNFQLLSGADLALDIQLPEQPLWVLGEEAALERILQNLLQNAGRYAESRLAISTSEADGLRQFRFSNDAPALSEETTARLFERFYTPDSSRHQASTGLGLTVARALAREMQGDLTAELDSGMLHFTLTLKAL